MRSFKNHKNISESRLAQNLLSLVPGRFGFKASPIPSLIQECPGRGSLFSWSSLKKNSF